MSTHKKRPPVTFCYQKPFYFLPLFRNFLQLVHDKHNIGHIADDIACIIGDNRSNINGGLTAVQNLALYGQGKQTLIVILPSILAMYSLSKKWNFLAAAIMILAVVGMFHI